MLKFNLNNHLLFGCPYFVNFLSQKKNRKLKGTNIDTIATLIDVIENLQLVHQLLLNNQI